MRTPKPPGKWPTYRRFADIVSAGRKIIADRGGNRTQSPRCRGRREKAMSRSGYSDDGDYDQWRTICWRGAVASAIRGKRGQAFLKEMLSALDALPEKRLIDGELEASGQVCALGSVGKARGVDMSKIDPEDRETVAGTFGIPLSLAAEVMWENDDAGFYKETPEVRFSRVRAWVAAQIRETAA